MSEAYGEALALDQATLRAAAQLASVAPVGVVSEVPLRSCKRARDCMGLQERRLRLRSPPPGCRLHTTDTGIGYRSEVCLGA